MRPLKRKETNHRVKHTILNADPLNYREMLWRFRRGHLGMSKVAELVAQVP